MEEEQDEASWNKHVCKVCKRRFGCGRALGGHMRIHGSGSVVKEYSEDDGHGVMKRVRDEVEEYEEREKEKENEGEASSGLGDHLEMKKNEQMYDLRPNRRRTWRFADLEYSFAAANADFSTSKFPLVKKYQSCGECGEEFSSWKSLIRHMECHFDDNKGREGEDDDDDGEEQSESNVKEEEGEVGVFWDSGSETERAPERKKSTKGKRSNRSSNSNVNSNMNNRIRHSHSSEVEFMASCLVMMASSGESWEPTINKPSALDDDCTTSGVRDLKRKRRRTTTTIPLGQDSSKQIAATPKKEMKYECKTCKKMFSSFQALGGHRASHNKVKGCSAKQDAEEVEVEVEVEVEEEIITSDEDLTVPKSMNVPPDEEEEEEEEESVGLGSAISENKSPWLDLNLPAVADDEPKWFHHESQGLCSISTLT